MTSGLYGYPADYLMWWLLWGSVVVHTWCFFRFFPRRRRPRIALVLGNALVCLSLLGVVGLAAETYLRFLSNATDPFGMTMSARRWFAFHGPLNSGRFRDREWLPQPPENVYRIAFVGDSFLYGWGIERTEDRLSERVAQELVRRRRRPVESMNVAKPGWDTGDQITALTAILNRYHVNEVVLCYVPNDIERLLPVEPGFDPKVPPRCGWFNTDASALIEYIYYRVYLPYVPTVRNYHDWLADGYADPRIWSAQQERLRTMATLCRDRGIAFKVAVFPFLRTGGERFDAGRIQNQVIACLKDMAIPVVDLAPVFAAHAAERLVVSASDAHPNERAHQLAAEAIVGALFGGGQRFIPSAAGFE